MHNTVNLFHNALQFTHIIMDLTQAQPSDLHEKAETTQNSL